jgi:hypothetical protein
MRILISIQFLQLLLLLTSCSYKVSRNYTHSSFIETDTSQIQIFKRKDLVGIPRSYRGSIKLDDHGFTINCSERKAMEVLKLEAIRQSANVINIRVESLAHASISTCYRCIADFYKINLDSTHRSILAQPKRDTITSLNTKKPEIGSINRTLNENDSFAFKFYFTLGAYSGGASFWNGKYYNFRTIVVFYKDVSAIKNKFRNYQGQEILNKAYQISLDKARNLETILNEKKLSGQEVSTLTNQYTDSLQIVLLRLQETYK